MIGLIEIAGYIDRIERETGFHLKLTHSYKKVVFTTSQNYYQFKIKEKPYLCIKIYIINFLEGHSKCGLKEITYILYKDGWAIMSEYNSNFNSIVNKIKSL